MPTRILLCAAMVLGACDCGEKSDMERLREQVDTTKVHLWVAAKVAFTKANSDDPDVVQARQKLMALMEAYHHAQEADPEDVAEADADGDGDADEPLPTLSASEAVDLAVALWELRETGARIVREDSEDELDPVLPVLLASRGVVPDLALRIDGNTEHALLMLGLFVVKLHPKGPTPVPVEILLYEGMHVDVDQLAFPGLKDPTLAARSYLYANSDYCDLAKADAAALDEGEAQHLSDLMSELGGDSLAAEDARRAAGALQAIGHGSTAICYLEREEEDEAEEELQAFVDAAERGGAAPEDLAIIRAYLAYRKDDLEETRAQLALAKTSERLDDEERAEIDELIAHLDREETGALDVYFDEAAVGTALLAVTWHELEKAGVLDALADAPLFHGISDFVRGATGAVTDASAAVDQASEAASDTAEGVVEGGRKLLDGVLGD
jgi:hypothetical protein